MYPVCLHYKYITDVPSLHGHAYMRVLNTLQIMFCCQQAKALNAMDEEFGIGDLVEEEFGAKKVCDSTQEKDQC